MEPYWQVLASISAAAVPYCFSGKSVAKQTMTSRCDTEKDRESELQIFLAFFHLFFMVNLVTLQLSAPPINIYSHLHTSGLNDYFKGRELQQQPDGQTH
jgi:hypothetical protein